MGSAARRDRALEAARRHADRGEVQQALDQLQSIIELDPTDTAACIVLGDVYMQARQTAEAARAYVQAALACSEDGRLDEAIGLFRERVIPSQPASVNARLRLGELYRRKGMIQEALAEYRSGARIFEQRGKDDDAARVLQHILMMDAGDVASRVRLAEVYSRQGDPEAAVEELAMAGEHLRKANRLNEYLRVAERLLHHQPDNMPVLRDVVKLCLEIGRPHKALARIQRRLQQDPKDLDALELLVRTFDGLKEPKKAAEVLKEIARTHEGAGRQRQRDGALRRVLERTPDDAEVARALEGSGRALDDEKTSPREAPAPVTEISQVVELSLEDLDELRAATPIPMGRTRVDSEPSVPPLVGEGERDRVMAEVAIYLKHGLTSRARKNLEWILSSDPHYEPAADKMRALSFELDDDDLDDEGRRSTEELDLDELELVDDAGHDDSIREILEDVGYLWEQGLLDQAQEVLERAVIRFPDSSELRQRKEAIEDLRDGMESTQEIELEVPVDELLAPVFVRQQSVADGMDMDGQAHFDLGITYREMGLTDQALAEFEAALGARVRRAECYRLIGLCYRDRGDLEAASDNFRKGLGIRDGGDMAAASLHFELAEVEAARGDTESAADEYAEVKRLDPRYPGLGDRLRALEVKA